MPLDQLIDECRTIFDLSRHNGHPRFFGYVASPSTPIGAYGDLIASALNANITCWRSGPAGTELERLVVRWLGSLIGYDAQAQGLLTSGGSMANMIALLIASRRKLNASRQGLWNSGPPMTVYASEEVHMSIPKAADILGFGRDQVRVVACDHQRMRVDSLRQKIEADLREGLETVLRRCQCGHCEHRRRRSTRWIANVAKSSISGFTSMVRMARPVFWTSERNLSCGLERADSVSLDPHKWLYVPVDAGCLLFRDSLAAGAASTPKTLTTSRRTDTVMKKLSLSGITALNCRVVSGRSRFG